MLSGLLLGRSLESKLISKATYNEKLKTVITWLEERDGQHRDKYVQITMQ